MKRCMGPKLIYGGKASLHVNVQSIICAFVVLPLLTPIFTYSIGCIFGELIIKDAIMQGQGELDQIDKIFKLVGIPTDESWPDFSKLPSSGIFRWKSLKGGSELASKFPVNSPSGGQAFLDGNGFDLLTKLLTLNPKKRITAEQALNHPYFKEGVEKQMPTFYFD